MKKPLQKITPHLWYTKEAEEAARFYCSVFPDSKIERVTLLPQDSPSGGAGTVPVVEFTLLGQSFMAISAGPLDPFNHAISFMVSCESQQEIDRYWEALGQGGSIEPCGWLKDRFGVSWQIVPAQLQDMLADPDRQKAARAGAAMMKMKKIELGALQRAFDGK